VLKKWTNNIIISATAAYIFAFGIYNIGHFHHVQIFPKFIAPLVVFCFWKFLSAKQLKYFLFASLGLVFQFYCGIYLGFFLIYGLLFLFLAYFIIYKDWEFFKQFYNIKFTVIFSFILIISAILLSFIMIPYYEITKATEMCHFKDIISYIPRPVSYFFAHITAGNWYILTQHSQYAFPNWWSHFHFVGALPWIGIFMSIYLLFSNKIKQEPKKFIYFLLLALFLNIIFCLNIGGFTLYKIIYLLPGFSSMRSIDRIINIQILFFLLVFVFAFNELLKINKAVKWLIYLLPILVIIDNYINTSDLKSFDKATAQAKVKEIENRIAEKYNKKYKAIAYIPVVLKPTEPYKYIETVEIQISSILAAQELNIPIVNSYTGHYPEDYLPFFENINYASLNNWCKFNNYNINEIQLINDINANVLSEKSVFLKAANGKYLCADANLQNKIIADKESPSLWECFTLFSLDNGSCCLLSYENNAVTVSEKSPYEINATKDYLDKYGYFIIQKTDENHIAFKTVHGNYLSVDKDGNVSATAKTINKNEMFELINK
jgi:hypothetical protein